MDIQVRCNLLPASGLPEDIVVNTFAVDWAGGTDYGDVFTAFERFYNAPVTPDVMCIANYIGWTVVRDDGLLMEVVEEPQTPPNVPAAYAQTDLACSSSTGDCDDGPIDPLPQEVSVCSSMFAAGYPGGSVTPGRLRGRVYIGPLSFSSIEGIANELPSRPSDVFIERLVNATERLAAELLVEGHTLCIWSRADDVFRPVVGGWVDNEWDTQRRRGRERTARVFWP